MNSKQWLSSRLLRKTIILLFMTIYFGAIAVFISGCNRQSKEELARVKLLSAALRLYKEDHDLLLPFELQDLVKKGLIKEDNLKDLWGNDYYYNFKPISVRTLSTTPRLISYGADGKPGGTGLNADIVLYGDWSTEILDK